MEIAMKDKDVRYNIFSAINDDETRMDKSIQVGSHIFMPMMRVCERVMKSITEKRTKAQRGATESSSRKGLRGKGVETALPRQTYFTAPVDITDNYEYIREQLGERMQSMELKYTEDGKTSRIDIKKLLLEYIKIKGLEIDKMIRLDRFLVKFFGDEELGVISKGRKSYIASTDQKAKWVIIKAIANPHVPSYRPRQKREQGSAEQEHHSHASRDESAPEKESASEDEPQQARRQQPHVHGVAAGSEAGTATGGKGGSDRAKKGGRERRE